MRFLVLLLFFPLFTTAQNPLNPEISLLREHIYNGIHEDLKQKKWERRTYHFANQAANSIYDIINSGQVYRNKPGMEAYVNHILQRILPAHLKGDSVIHAYITHNGGINAFMTPSGSMFINIGILSEVDDEATLAAILAHEVAHYDQQHSLNGFIKSVSGAFRTGLFDNHPDEKFSIANEYQSDSLSMIWLTDAGYSLEGAEKCFRILENLYENRLNRTENKWSFKEETHPIPANRKEKLKEYRSKITDTGEAYLISAKAFAIFKEEAKKETLDFFLKNFYYDQCIEKAFKFHLFDPNNPDYIFYLLESIRRKCYLDVSMWKENFITYRYYQSRDVSDRKVKDLMTASLFEKFDPAILQIRIEEIADMKAKFYWNDAPKFHTYEQAFDFFSRVGLILGNKEILLVNALSFTHSDSARDYMLTSYLSHPNIKYRKYAQTLLDDSIYLKLEDKKLCVFDDFTVSIKQGDDFIYLDNTLDENRKIINTLIKPAIDLHPQRKLILMDSIRNIDPEEFRLLQRMMEFSIRSLIAQGIKTELHILEPDFWEVFDKYNVNEVEFISCWYLDARKSESTKEEYEIALNTSFDQLFDEVKKTRDMTVFIGSLREMEEKKMKHRFYTKNGFRFKEPARDEISAWFVKNIEEKEKRASIADSEYLYFKD